MEHEALLLEQNHLIILVLATDQWSTEVLLLEQNHLIILVLATANQSSGEHLSLELHRDFRVYEQ